MTLILSSSSFKISLDFHPNLPLKPPSHGCFRTFPHPDHVVVNNAIPGASFHTFAHGNCLQHTLPYRPDLIVFEHVSYLEPHAPGSSNWVWVWAESSMPCPIVVPACLIERNAIMERNTIMRVMTALVPPTQVLPDVNRSTLSSTLNLHTSSGATLDYLLNRFRFSFNTSDLPPIIFLSMPRLPLECGPKHIQVRKSVEARKSDGAVTRGKGAEPFSPSEDRSDPHSST